MQISRLNNSRNVRIKNSKLLGYYFHANTNIKGDFQIYISVPLMTNKNIQNPMEKIIVRCQFHLVF